MKLLLIYPPRRSDSYFFPPLSLLYILQAAKEEGHDAKIIDIPYLIQQNPERFSLLDDSIYNYILEQDFNVLGLGGVVSTYFYYDYFVPRFRKDRNNIPIVAGGSVGVPIKDVWEKHTPVDYLVEGDGEIVIRKLLNGLEKKDFDSIRKIDGLHCLTDRKFQSNPPKVMANLDSIPYVTYDDIDVEFYIDNLSKWIRDVLPNNDFIKADELRALPLLTSRGCPFGCTFCFHFNNSYRHHSVSYVIDNIKYLINRYRINLFYIIDDLFICNKKFVIDLCEKIASEKMGAYFFAGGGKPSLVDSEMLESMQRAGFIRLSYGIESGSQKILDTMQKKTTVKQNLDALKLTEKKGVPSYANMIFGMVGENEATINETRKFLIKAGLNSSRFSGGWATAYPGTPLFNWMVKNNMIDDVRKYLFNVGSISSYVYNLSELSEKRLRQKVYELYREVDLAYDLRHKKYLKFLKGWLKYKTRNVLRRLPEEWRIGIEAYLSKLGITSQAPKGARNVLKSCVEVERFLVKYLSEHDQLGEPSARV